MNKSEQGFDKTAPVSVNQVLEVQIDGMGEKGDPVAHVQRFAIFVKHNGLQSGDKVNVRITKVFAKFAFADLVDINETGGEIVG